MTPELALSWLRVIRDTLLLVIGIAMLCYATLEVHEKERLTIILGTGLFACGLPVAFRWPMLFEARDDTSKGTK